MRPGSLGPGLCSWGPGPRPGGGKVLSKLLGAAVAELLGAAVAELLGAAVAELLGAAVELLLSMFIRDRFEKLFCRSESLRDFSERNQNSRFSMREKCQIGFFKCRIGF